MKNIANVVADGLCTNCGTCTGICPTEAIKMQVSNGLNLPKIEEEKCTCCRLCVKSCPGHSVNFNEFNLRNFGKQPEDKLLGNYLKCYVGHSNDDEIRYNSSSGGVVTQLLIFALEKGIIDGALVVRMKKSKHFETEPFIARTRKEIISASKSKYCPVATNQALRHILKEKGRFAVVGLPCHIHGIRKAEMNVRALKEKIALHIGLVCSHTVSFFGTEFLLQKLGISQEQIVGIDYRGSGRPGSMLIKLKNNSSLSFPLLGKWKAYWPIFSSFFFTPARCTMCPDQANELADVSVGDAWLPELRKERKGESIIITRMNDGEEILKQACSAGVLFLKSIECERAKRSFGADTLKFKKNDLPTRLAMINSAGMKIPDFNLKQSSSIPLTSFVRNLFVFFNVKASQNGILEKLLLFVPFQIFRLYYGVYEFLCLF